MHLTGQHEGLLGKTDSPSHMTRRFLLIKGITSPLFHGASKQGQVVSSCQGTCTACIFQQQHGACMKTSSDPKAGLSTSSGKRSSGKSAKVYGVRGDQDDWGQDTSCETSSAIPLFLPLWEKLVTSLGQALSAEAFKSSLSLKEAVYHQPLSTCSHLMMQIWYSVHEENAGDSRGKHMYRRLACVSVAEYATAGQYKQQLQLERESLQFFW